MILEKAVFVKADSTGMSMKLMAKMRMSPGCGKLTIQGPGLGMTVSTTIGNDGPMIHGISNKTAM